MLHNVYICYIYVCIYIYIYIYAYTYIYGKFTTFTKLVYIYMYILYTSKKVLLIIQSLLESYNRKANMETANKLIIQNIWKSFFYIYTPHTHIFYMYMN